MKPVIILLPVMSLCLFLSVDRTEAQLTVGTEFTYQGNLVDGAQAATGTYSMTFRLYNSPSGMDPLNDLISMQSFAAVDVEGGLFAVELDFGAGAFDGDARWLEVEINGETLAPRQSITATPYSTFSQNTRGIHVDGNRVGIGTDSPQRVLHTVGDAILVERDTADSAVIMRHSGDGISQGLIGVRSTGTDEGLMIITDANQDIVQSLKDGRVGLGTLEPERILHTRGDAILVERGANDAAVAMRNTTNGEIEGQIGCRSTGANDGYMFVSDERLERLLFLNDGYVGIGSESPVVDDPTGQSWFDIRIPATGDQVGGMFIDNENIGQRTVYGFASGGVSQAVMSFDDANDTWALDIGPSVQDEFVVKGNGRVGIGTFNPTVLLDVNGSARISGNFETSDDTPCKPNGGSWASCSDRRYKKNIKSLGATLDKLLQLRGVTFEYKDPESINELPGIKVGMIAQEVEKVFPNWVVEKSDGYKLLSPSGFEALTVEALRELRKEKDRQFRQMKKEHDEQIAELKDENDELRQRLESLETAVASMNSN